MAIFNLMRLASLSIILFVVACETFSTRPINLIQTESPFELLTLEGSSYNLKDTVQSHDATVLIWWATQCPCVQRFQTRMHALREAYPRNQVAIVAVSSNIDDSSDHIRQIAADRQFDLPIVIDHQARLADMLGVQTTPTVILIDKQGNVMFKGWIDNERLPEYAGRIPYLQNALDELLAEKRVSMARSPTYGCMITKSLR